MTYYSEHKEERKEYARLHKDRCNELRNIRRRTPEGREAKRKEAKKQYRNTMARKYNISGESIDVLLSITCCEICGSNPKILHIDHDHETGNVRGRLCSNCNLALGLLNDNISTLEKSIQYLKEKAVPKYT